MTDTEIDPSDFKAHHESLRASRLLVEKRYAEIIKGFTAPTAIDFYAQPVIDDYGVMTLGEWGGYLVQIMEMAFNHRLILTPANGIGGYDHGWCYDKGGVALLAALAWNPDSQGEPLGFKRRATAGLREPGEKPNADGDVPAWLQKVVTKWQS